MKINKYIIILLLLLLIPINKKAAPLRNIELENQFNTGVRSTYSIPHIEKIDKDLYFILDRIENDNKEAVNGFAIYDSKGKLQHKQTIESDLYSDFVAEKEYSYFFRGSTIRKMDNLTGEIIKEYKAEINLNYGYITEEGIAFSVYNYNTKKREYYIIDRELTKTTKLNEMPAEKERVNIDKVDEETKNKFYEYLYNNSSITPDEFVIDYVVESDNQYYSAVEKEGKIYSLVYTDKEFENIGFMPIINSDIQTEYVDYYASGNNVLDIYTKNSSVIVFIGQELEVCPASVVEYHGCGVNAIMQIYSEDYLIDTKTDGNGEVKADYVKAKEGTEVKFTITPKDGYVLGEVKVTDDNGNVIVFTENTFTMPSADVLIEATFKKIEPPKEEKNPETSDYISLYIAVAIFVIEVFIIRYLYKKEY